MRRAVTADEGCAAKRMKRTPSTQDTAEAVLEFVSREIADRRQRVLPGTDLYEDLDLAGIDVEEFFLAFCKRFHVPQEGLVFDGCFHGEYWVPRFMRTWFFRPTKRFLVYEVRLQPVLVCRPDVYPGPSNQRGNLRRQVFACNILLRPAHDRSRL
jgi:hypothetical protein